MYCPSLKYKLPLDLKSAAFITCKAYIIRNT